MSILGGLGKSAMSAEKSVATAAPETSKFEDLVKNGGKATSGAKDEEVAPKAKGFEKFYENNKGKIAVANDAASLGSSAKMILSDASGSSGSSNLASATAAGAGAGAGAGGLTQAQAASLKQQQQSFLQGFMGSGIQNAGGSVGS